MKLLSRFTLVLNLILGQFAFSQVAPTINPAPIYTTHQDKTAVPGPHGWSFTNAAQAQRRKLLLSKTDELIEYQVEFARQLEVEDNSDLRETFTTLVLLLYSGSVIPTSISFGYWAYIGYLWRTAYYLSQKIESDFSNYMAGFKMPYHVYTEDRVATNIRNQLNDIFEFVKKEIDREMTPFEKFVIRNGVLNNAIDQLGGERENILYRKSLAGTTFSGQYDPTDYRLQTRTSRSAMSSNATKLQGVTDEIAVLYRDHFNKIIPELVLSEKVPGTFIPSSLPEVMEAMSKYPNYTDRGLADQANRLAVIDDLKQSNSNRYLRNLNRKTSRLSWRQPQHFSLSHLARLDKKAKSVATKAGLVSGGLLVVTVIMALVQSGEDENRQSQVTKEMFENANNPEHFKLLVQRASDPNQATHFLIDTLAATADIIKVFQQPASDIFASETLPIDPTNDRLFVQGFFDSEYNIPRDAQGERRTTQGLTACQYLLSQNNPLCAIDIGPI